MKTSSVILVDDHTLVRAGLRQLLEKIPTVTVIGEAADGAGAMELMRESRPDIVITDIAMSGMSGLALAANIGQEFPGVRVMFLSMHRETETVQGALRAGAAAYLLKDAATMELELAIQAVAKGDTYLSPAVSKQVVEGYIDTLDSPLDVLTGRQREILTLLARGLAAKEIAHELDISPKTVEAHRSQIMARLQIHDLAGLVRFAVRTGLINPAT